MNMPSELTDPEIMRDIIKHIHLDKFVTRALPALTLALPWEGMERQIPLPLEKLPPVNMMLSRIRYTQRLLSSRVGSWNDGVEITLKRFLCLEVNLN